MTAIDGTPGLTPSGGASVHAIDRPASVVRQALRMRRTQIGLVVAGAMVAIALFGPYVAPYGARQYVGSPNLRRAPKTHFGTDYFGQDVWSRFLHGGRSILILAVCATVLGVGLGTLFGLTAAYARGRTDELLMRALDILLAFPQVLLSLVVIAMFSPSGLVVVLTVGFTTVPRVARIMRGAAIGVVERDFIGAAEAIGESRRRVLFSEILPNVSATLLVEANLRLTYAVGLIASLSFLGFTPELNSANWGLMIQENGSALTVQPLGVFLPTFAIAALTVGNGLISDGLSRVVAGIDRGKANV